MSDVSRRSLLMAGAAAGTGLVACGKSTDSDGSASSSSTPPSDPRSIATDAYIFGYPLVLVDVTRESSAAALPANQIAAIGAIDPTLNAVVMPNIDTVYAGAWLDLRAEPVVLQVPEMDPGRYWLMQIMDAWTNTAHNPSSVAPQVKAGQNPPYGYAITGPNWSGTLPDNLTRLAMPTATAWLIGRIELRNSADLAAADGLLRQVLMAPLSVWQRGERPPPIIDPETAIPISPPQQVARMDGRTFFDRLCALMVTNPPAADDAPAMHRFSKIGIGPGGKVDGVAVADLNAAVAAGQLHIPDYANPEARRENGWDLATNLGAYGTDYLLRASTAWTALGANLPQDSVYPEISANAGEQGAPRRYRLRFEPGQSPPARAFWSLTAYTAERYLVPNAAGIYSVGHQRPVVPLPDGAVELAIQADDPGPDVPQGNWLPIPESGTFRLALRLYVPEDRALDGSWKPPSLVRVG
ncbi:DUF1254 domain-containing protein [Nocardia sp. NBC_00565]|uniref:DUF1254 domain-containing protein n=1 Tax=Nocardia sp. NBC_00565 TaxID=2975993 RepID=UPI002E8219DF|nr:DUF1254 domain-containing protein [Nocardia sp. NBC_00565]WUC04186.1 DUF1254 domain-containing protein [Nocardia sp. NBC_00565]